MAHNESEHRSKCPKWAHTPTETDNVQYKIKQSATDYINLVHPQVPLSLLQLLDPPDNLLDSPPHLLPLLDHTQNTLNVMHIAKTSIHNAYRNESGRTVKFHSYNVIR